MSRDKYISAKSMESELVKGKSTNPLVLDCQETFEKCLAILEAKNADYSSESDPLKNFNASEIVGVQRERAILVRIMDKISRISNLLEKEPLVVEERIEDTINDAINYLAILQYTYKQIK